MPSPIQRTPVQSSNVVSVGYEPANRTLAVEFRGGSVYHYSGVPAEIHQQLMSAPSKGRFLREAVIGKFQHQKVS